MKAKYPLLADEIQRYIDKLNSIPHDVHTTVTTNLVTTGTTARVGDIAQRAAGGPVSANTPYVVGEVGPELFVPGASGNIIPAGKTAAMMSGGGSGGATINITVNAGLGTDGVALGRVLVKAIKDAEGRDGIGWRS